MDPAEPVEPTKSVAAVSAAEPVAAAERDEHDSLAGSGSLAAPDSLVESDSLAEPGTAAEPDSVAESVAVVRPRPMWRRVIGWAISLVAAALVLFALVVPNQIVLLTPRAFLRVPIEGLVVAAAMLLLPPRFKRVGTVLAVLVGVALGLLTIIKIADMGFYEILNREFDPVLDWTLLGDGVDFLTKSIGRWGAIGAEVGAALLVVVVLVLMALSAVRLVRLAGRHRTNAAGTIAVLGIAWVICTVSGAQIVPGMPVASRDAYTLSYQRLQEVRAGLRDERSFAARAGADPYASVPGSQLLTGLRGKDVMITFVESYGRVAIDDPVYAPQTAALLDAGTKSLAAAGFGARSAWITSSTVTGASWLAHSTLLSGLWINNQERYNNLLASDRFTLTRAFGRAGWRTVGVEPAVTRAWPEGAFYGYNHIYTAQNLGYKGPPFNFASMPDQYTLATFQRLERSAPGHAPVMSEMALLTSHAPWAPLPSEVDWNAVGNGAVYDGMPAEGQSPDSMLGDRTRIRTAYIESIEYSLNTLISYVENYGGDNLVLVFLGDHQPAPVITGGDGNRDVPITIVAHDPSVLNRIAGWGWQDGLRPGPAAPVWRMDGFRNQFLTAFGPQGGAASSPATPPGSSGPSAPSGPETSPSPPAH